jgi:hypothetical protein
MHGLGNVMQRPAQHAVFFRVVHEAKHVYPHAAFDPRAAAQIAIALPICGVKLE